MSVPFHPCMDRPTDRRHVHGDVHGVTVTRAPPTDRPVHDMMHAHHRLTGREEEVHDMMPDAWACGVRWSPLDPSAAASPLGVTYLPSARASLDGRIPADHDSGIVRRDSDGGARLAAAQRAHKACVRCRPTRLRSARNGATRTHHPNERTNGRIAPAYLFQSPPTLGLAVGHCFGILCYLLLQV